MAEHIEHIEIVPIAIDEYADPHLTVLNTQEQVDALVGILTEFGGVLIDWDTPMRKRGRDAIDARLAMWSRADHPHSLLYWVGHASSDRAHPRLQHAASDEQAGLPGITAGHIARTIAHRSSESDEHWHLVVIDSCWSASFIQHVSAVLDTLPGTRQVLLVGTSGDGSTTLGRFTDALRAVLRHNFGGVREISLWDLAGGLRRALPEAETVPKQIMHGALHRATVVTGAALDVVDDVRAVLTELSEDERRHFIPKAQGGELGELTWYFEGRQAEMTSVTRWLAEHEGGGLLAVTGPPGSGKSAMLGYLLVHTSPHLRTVLVRHKLLSERPKNQSPPDDTFTVVLHLTGLSTQDAIARVAGDLHLGDLLVDKDLSAQIEWLLTRLIRRSPITLLVDALDEAVDPLTVAGALLRRLGVVPGVRVVVGTRRDTREGPDQPETDQRNLLDALQTGETDIITVTQDRTAIGQYVANRLATAADRGLLPHDPRAVTRIATRIGLGHGEFLYARLAVYDILAAGRLPTETELGELLTADHRGLFRRALTRISASHPANLPILRALAYSQGRGLPIQDGVLATVASALSVREITDSNIHNLLDAAAPYVLLDTEHGQTVHRLAHRTFAEHFTTDRADSAAAHQAITAALIGVVTAQPDQPLNPYSTRYLSTHAAHLGEPGWIQLDNHPNVLDRLDPVALSADAMRTAFGHYPLPPTIAGVISANHQMATAERSDWAGLRQLAMVRHTNVRISEHSTPHDGWRVTWATLDPYPASRTLTGHNGSVVAVAGLSLPDGRTILASGGSDRTVRLWDPVTATPLGEPLVGHTAGVTAVTGLSLPDGRTVLASGSSDGEVRLWDPVTATPLGARIGLRPGTTVMVGVSLPDGRTVLTTGSSDGEVRLWDPVTATPLGKPLVGHTAGVTAVTGLSLPDGRTLLASGSSDGEVRLWDPVTATPLREPLIGEHKVAAVAAVPLPDGRQLIAVSTGRWNKRVQLWDPLTGDPVGHLFPTTRTGDVAAITTLSLPDGRTLLATSGYGGTALWDPLTRELIGDPLDDYNHTYHVAAAAMTLSDGRTLIATGSGSGNSILLWAPLITPANHRNRKHIGRVATLAKVPLPESRTVIAAGGRDGTMRFWDTLKASSIDSRIGERMGSITAMTTVPLPDGRTLLAVGGNDESAQLWEPMTASRVGDRLTGHVGGVATIATMRQPDGRVILAVGAHDGVVRLWDVKTTTQLDKPAVPIREIYSIAAVPRPDGSFLLAMASSVDGSVWLWDPFTRNETSDAPSDYNSLMIATTQHMIIASDSQDGMLLLWEPKTLRSDEQFSSESSGVPVLAGLSSPDGRSVLASGSEDGILRLWDTDSGTLTMRIDLRTPIYAITHWDGDTIAVGLADGLALISLGLN